MLSDLEKQAFNAAFQNCLGKIFDVANTAILTARDEAEKAQALERAKLGIAKARETLEMCLGL